MDRGKSWHHFLTALEIPYPQNGLGLVAPATRAEMRHKLPPLPAPKLCAFFQ